jgi:hypothetical protein
MRLSNRFSEEDKIVVWGDHPYCAYPNCMSNQNCSVHHIYGAKGTFNNSICNSIMLCYKHHKLADGHNIHAVGDPFRIMLLRIILIRLVRIKYRFKNRDERFLKDIKQDVDSIL